MQQSFAIEMYGNNIFERNLVTRSVLANIVNNLVIWFNYDPISLMDALKSKIKLFIRSHFVIDIFKNESKSTTCFSFAN